MHVNRIDHRPDTALTVTIDNRLRRRPRAPFFLSAFFRICYRIYPRPVRIYPRLLSLCFLNCSIRFL